MKEVFLLDNVLKYLRIVFNILIPLAGIYLICVWGPKMLGFFLPFVIGWVIALIANPLVRFLERRLKIVRRHSSALIIIGVLGIIVVLLYWITSLLYVELYGFLKNLPQLYENAIQDITGALQNSRKLFEFLPDSIQVYVDQFSSNFGTYIGTFFSKMAAPTVEIAGNVAKGLPGVLVNTVITILSAYFFIAEQDKMLLWLKSHSPKFAQNYIAYLKKDAKGLIGGYFLAQFRIMFVIAAIMAVGLLILGVDYGLVLAILISLLDFLPVFGTGTVLIPWGIVKLFTGAYAYGAGLILLYITTQVVRQIIQPKIVGDTMGLPPLMTLVLLYLGYKAAGLAGMIFAVPVGLVFINFYNYGAFDSLIENLKILIHDVNEFRKK